MTLSSNKQFSSHFESHSSENNGNLASQGERKRKNPHKSDHFFTKYRRSTSPVFRADRHMAKYDCFSKNFTIDDKTRHGRKSRLGRRKKSSNAHHKQEIESSVSFEDIENVHDVFLLILRNFVSDSGLVDGQSIRSVLLVSKSWYDIASSTTLWGLAANPAYCLDHNRSIQAIHIERTQLKKNLNPNKNGKITEIHSSRKICAILHLAQKEPPVSKTCSTSMKKKHFRQTIVSPKIQDKLIAFAKLGIHSIGSEGICFKAKERATGHLFAIKAPWNFDYDRSDYYSNDEEGKSQPSTTLREIAALQRLRGPDYFSANEKDAECERAHNHVCLPQGLSMINGHLLRWYDFIEFSIEDFIQYKSDQKHYSPPPSHIVKSWIHQILKGLEYLHRKGVIHRNLKPKHLLLKNLTNLSEEQRAQDLSKVIIKIADFTLVRVNSFPRRPLTPKVVSLWYRPPEILLGNDKYTTAVDMWSIGCIFAEIVLGRALFPGTSETDQIMQVLEPVDNSNLSFDQKRRSDSYSNKVWLGQKIPNLCEQGIDLLSKLLEMDQDKRISANDALKHPFFVETMDKNNRTKCRHTGESICSEIRSTKNRDTCLSISKELLSLEASIPKSPVTISNLQSSNQQLSRYIRSDTKTIIRIDQWAKLVDWLIEIVDVFDKHPRTVFLAMNFFFKFITSIKVPKSRQYQLIAASCLHIASKCEDVNCIGLTDLVFSADNTFSGDDIILMEKKILANINWRLSDPLLYDFVSLYMGYLEETFTAFNISLVRAHSMVQYLSELTLQCYMPPTFYDPSLVAACVLSLALQCLTGSMNTGSNVDNLEIIWPKNLGEISNYELDTKKKNIEDCRNVLLSNLNQVKAMFPELKIIAKRYRKKERGRVSEIRIPSTLLFVEVD